MLLRTIADFMGWLAYLSIMGGGIVDRELLFPSAANPPGSNDGRAGEPDRVLRLADYRQLQHPRRRSGERKPPRAA